MRRVSRSNRVVRKRVNRAQRRGLLSQLSAQESRLKKVTNELQGVKKKANLIDKSVAIMEKIL